MKRAVASKNSRSKRVDSLESEKPQQSAKVLKLKIPKKRQIKLRNVLLVCLLVALCLWSIYPLKQRAEQQRENSLLRAEIEELQGKNKKLGEEVKRLKSDEYVEQLARRDLGLVKPGETSVWVIPAEDGEFEDSEAKAGKNKEQEDKTEAAKQDSNKDKKKSKQDSKKESESTKQVNKSKTGSDQSWWQKALSYLDRLTGAKNR